VEEDIVSKGTNLTHSLSFLEVRYYAVDGLGSWAAWRILPRHWTSPRVAARERDVWVGNQIADGHKVEARVVTFNRGREYAARGEG
jgi:hypothetical protein